MAFPTRRERHHFKVLDLETVWRKQARFNAVGFLSVRVLYLSLFPMPLGTFEPRRPLQPPLPQLLSMDGANQGV